MLRLTFSIIVLESFRRIATWVVFADITFLLYLPTPHHHTHYSRDAPHLWGFGTHGRQSPTVCILPGPLANSLLHFACIRRDSITFYATLFYGAACYVFAYGWRLGQPVVQSELPIGSNLSHTLNVHAHVAGRAIQLASLSRSVAIAVIWTSPSAGSHKPLPMVRPVIPHSQDLCPTRTQAP